ncbi:hypothetical protein T484DRAFT_1894943 [Baffinella frigidus]|nr:hypothetical protein T484DRAFT_1894943 [Cryptophyta sp. CCMP2293]
MEEASAGSMEPDSFRFERRALPKWVKRPQDLFMSRRQSIPALRRRISQLLEKEGEVCLHATGAAVERAVSLALEVQAAAGSGDLELSVNTSTVVATDDWAPLDAEGVCAETGERRVSAVHVTISRKNASTRASRSASQ